MSTYTSNALIIYEWKERAYICSRAQGDVLHWFCRRDCQPRARFPFMLTCKSLRSAARRCLGPGVVLKSQVTQYVSILSLVKWAIKTGCGTGALWLVLLEEGTLTYFNDCVKDANLDAHETSTLAMQLPVMATCSCCSGREAASLNVPGVTPPAGGLLTCSNIYERRATPPWTKRVCNLYADRHPVVLAWAITAAE